MSSKQKITHLHPHKVKRQATSDSLEYSNNSSHASGYYDSGSGSTKGGVNSQLVSPSRSSSTHDVESYYREIFTKLPYNTQRAYISDYNEFAIFCKQANLQGFTDDFSHNELCMFYIDNAI